MKELSELNLLLFFAFVVPGFVSIRVFSLLHPVETKQLKDNILEAIAFSSMNFAVLAWAIIPISDPRFLDNNPWLFYSAILLVFLVAPTLWPVVLIRLLSFLQNKQVILGQLPTAWDHFFSRREGCWVIAHLPDGRRIGGLFGSSSYATSYPNEGHLYIEELWDLDANGAFRERIEGTQGVILRPEDYQFVEIFEWSSDDEQTEQ